MCTRAPIKRAQAQHIVIARRKEILLMTWHRTKADVSDGCFRANGFTKQAASLYDYSLPWFLMVTDGLQSDLHRLESILVKRRSDKLLPRCWDCTPLSSTTRHPIAQPFLSPFPSPFSCPFPFFLPSLSLSIQWCCLRNTRNLYRF